MTYYVVLSTLSLLGLTTSGLRNKGIYATILISLFIFSALRYEVGCDWPNYLLNYKAAYNLNYVDAASSLNPAHWLLLKLMASLNLDYQWLNIVTSLIFFSGLSAMAQRSQAPVPFLMLAFPLLVINMPMAAVKQAAAIGLLSHAFLSFIDGRRVSFVFLCVSATCFHSSAIIFLSFYPFISHDFTIKRVALSAFFIVPLAGVVMISDASDTLQTRYIEGDSFAAGAVFRSGLVFATGVLYLLALSKRWSATFPETEKFMVISSILMALLILVYPVSTVIADRLSYYLMLSQLLLFANLPSLFHPKFRTLFKWLPLVALSFLFVSWTLLSRHYEKCYDPYAIAIPGFVGW